MHVISTMADLRRALGCVAGRIGNGAPGSTRATEATPDRKTLATGFEAIDSMLPGGGGFARGVVHEVLGGSGKFAALVLPLIVARAAANQGGWVVVCDLEKRFYPPAAAMLGCPLERLVLLRPADRREQLWAATEALRCSGVGACVVSAPAWLSFLEARKLQLAAERGGGVGLLLRPARAVNQPFAAGSRWLVETVPGERNVQRWRAELIHGHGGRLNEAIVLELCRETHHVRATPALAGRADAKKDAPAPATTPSISAASA